MNFLSYYNYIFNANCSMLPLCLLNSKQTHWTVFLSVHSQLVPVVFLLELLHLTLQQQQLLASDGGGVQRVTAAQLLLQSTCLCLKGRLLLQSHRQLLEGKKQEQKTNIARRGVKLEDLVTDY